MQYTIVASAFLAGSSSARVSLVIQNLEKALFSETGGFFILETEGYGQVVVSGCGALYEIEVIPGHPLIIHNTHLIAWQDTLDFSISLSTTEEGLIKNLLNNFLSQTGIILKFSGYGKIIICSRNRYDLALLIKGKMS